MPKPNLSNSFYTIRRAHIVCPLMVPSRRGSSGCRESCLSARRCIRADDGPAVRRHPGPGVLASWVSTAVLTAGRPLPVHPDEQSHGAPVGKIDQACDCNCLGWKCGNFGLLKRNGFFECFPHPITRFENHKRVPCALSLRPKSRRSKGFEDVAKKRRFVALPIDRTGARRTASAAFPVLANIFTKLCFIEASLRLFAQTQNRRLLETES